jgi:magnesium chelatase family protein
MYAAAARLRRRPVDGRARSRRVGQVLIMTGPPGAGKTLLARALPSILPTMVIDEALDVTRVYSVAGQLPPGIPLIQQRPFREPDHSISHAGLVGGVHVPGPGEIRLAYRGIVLLDNRSGRTSHS